MKERIINCTLNQIEVSGLQKLTMDTIASELHISKRTIYQHFQSKEQLLETCLKEWLLRNKLLVPTGGNLIDELCALYTGIQSIDLPQVVHRCSELRKYSAPVHLFFLEQLFDYADTCGVWAERDADTGYLRRNISRHTVSAVVSDFLIRLFGNSEDHLFYRSYLLSPEILIVFTRGLCTIKGRAYLDQRLKTLA